MFTRSFQNRGQDQEQEQEDEGTEPGVEFILDDELLFDAPDIVRRAQEMARVGMDLILIVVGLGGNDATLRFHVARVQTAPRDVEPDELLGNRWPGFGLTFKGDIDQFLNHTTGHHYSLVFGDCVEELRYLAGMLNIGFVLDE